MKKKFAVLFVMSLIFSAFTGCGNKVETAQPVSEAALIETSAVETETDMENTFVQTEESQTAEMAETQTETEAETDTEPEFLSDGTFDEKDAMYRIDRLLMAYKDLILSNKETEYNLLDRVEKLDFMGTIIPKTKDGIELNITVEEADDPERKMGPGVTSWCVVTNYFYNYVNNNGEYYDFADYIESHTYDEIQHETLSDEDVEKFNFRTTNESIMSEAVGVALYLYEAKSIEIGEIYDKENLTMGVTSMNDTEVAYEATILVDGEFTGLTALYDEHGKMLNIASDDNFDSYIPTFNEGEVQVEVTDN